VYQIVSPGCTVVCAMEMGTPHTVNHIRAPYRATVQELHVANSWKVTPDGPVRAGSRVHFLTRHGWWEERFEVFDSAHGLGLRALREFKSTEPLMAYGDSVGGAMLGRKGEAKTEEAKRRLYETKGHYKSKYVMQIDRGGHTYEVDGRGCGNLVHLVNAYKTGDPGGRGWVNVHFAGQCTDGQRTYSVKKSKTIRKGDELLVVYGSYYWQELRRGMGCTQTQCAHNCPFRVNDDETEPAMGDWVQNGVVHREEDGQPTHDTGDVAESAQQSEGQLEQNTRSGGHDSQVLWEGDRSGNRGGLGISDGGHEHKGPFREKLVRDGVPATALDSAEYKQQRWQQLAEASGPPTLVD